jgi:hypothetical protein
VTTYSSDVQAQARTALEFLVRVRHVRPCSMGVRRCGAGPNRQNVAGIHKGLVLDGKGERFEDRLLIIGAALRRAMVSLSGRTARIPGTRRATL